MAAQDDAREKKMRDLFNLRKDPNRKRSDTDAYLDRPDADPLPFELKSTTKQSISTVRDFNSDHVKKWRDEHWIFGFFDEHQELQHCCYASPAMMKPWVDKLEEYVRPDVELAARLAPRVSEEDLVAILGDKPVYSLDDAKRIQKKQWKKREYEEQMDVEPAYTKAHLLELLPQSVSEEALVAALGDKPVYSLAEVKQFLGRGRWRRAMQPDISAGYTKTRMLDILRGRGRYLLERGATLNNPHIPKKFFDGFEKITANQASRVREMVAEAEALKAENVTPVEAAAMQEAAREAIDDAASTEDVEDAAG